MSTLTGTSGNDVLRGDAATLDVMAVLQKFPNVRPHPEAFIEALEALQPRLYSISSSPKVHKGRVSLTVDTVRYDMVRERGAWKIDDIRGLIDGKEWSIRKLLREEP